MGTMSGRPLLTSLWDKHELYSTTPLLTEYCIHTNSPHVIHNVMPTARPFALISGTTDWINASVLNACLFSSANGQFYDQINNVTSHVWLIDFSPSRYWTQRRHQFHPPLTSLPTAVLSTAEWLVSQFSISRQPVVPECVPICPNNI